MLLLIALGVQDVADTIEVETKTHGPLVNRSRFVCSSCWIIFISNSYYIQR